MLTKLRIQNFKSLQDTGDLAIRPLTFLVGPNSSGKSSVLQMLLMLRQTVLSSDVESPLVTNGPFIEVGAYPDFVFRHEAERKLEVATEWGEADPLAGGPMQVRAALRYDSTTTQILLAESEFRLRETFGESVRETDGGTYAGEAWRLGKDGRKVTQTLPGIRPLWWFFETTESLISGRTPIVVFSPRGILRWHMVRMAHLGPLRPYPRRFYPITGQNPAEVGSSGEWAFEVLWADNQSSDEQAGRLLQEVREWLSKFAIAESVRLDRLGESNQYEVVVTDPATKTEASFADIGFGASQVLPIVVQSFFARPASTLLVEQPEIHLHPKAQAELGDLFIAAAKSRDRAFIIETHSEHILARIRRRIAEGVPGITRDMVAIYYFEPTREGTKIRPVTLKENGQYEDYPSGFFEEDFEEALKHLEAMSKRP